MRRSRTLPWGRTRFSTLEEQEWSGGFISLFALSEHGAHKDLEKQLTCAVQQRLFI